MYEVGYSKMNKGNIMFWKSILISIYMTGTVAQFYEDQRCRCVCPTPTSIINITEKSDRTLYIAYVPRNKCNCYGVILPRVTNDIKDNAQLFCPRCDCKYETRNTTEIMVVVILVVWVIMLLIGYYIFLMLLEYLMVKKSNYTQAEKNTLESKVLLIQGEVNSDDNNSQ